jgi:hypothetical protein
MPDPGVSGGPGPNQGPLWFWSEEWGEMRHKDQVAKSGTYTNPITGKEVQGAPLGRGQVNTKRNTGMDIFSYVQPGPVDEPYRVITSYSDGRPDEIHWASGRTAQIVGDFDLTRPAMDDTMLLPRRVDNSREGNEGAEAPPPTVDVLEAMRRHPSFRIKTGRA